MNPRDLDNVSLLLPDEIERARRGAQGTGKAVVEMLQETCGLPPEDFVRALGATRRDILVHFLAENGILTTAGIALGVAGAYALDFALVSHVSQVTMDGRLVLAGMALLWALGLAATLPPALRAATVPPSTATRAV